MRRQRKRNEATVGFIVSSFGVRQNQLGKTLTAPYGRTFAVIDDGGYDRQRPDRKMFLRHLARLRFRYGFQTKDDIPTVSQVTFFEQ